MITDHPYRSCHYAQTDAMFNSAIVLDLCVCPYGILRCHKKGCGKTRAEHAVCCEGKDVTCPTHGTEFGKRRVLVNEYFEGGENRKMKLQFKLTFKRGAKTIAEVIGEEDIDAASMTVEDLVEGVQNAEHFIQRLTGLRLHIEQIG